MTDHASNSKRTFESTFGLLTKIEDRNGRAVTMSYRNVSGARGVEEIVDARGKTTSFDYNADNQIELVTHPAGREYGYGYSSDGQRLESYSDPAGGTTHYEYTGGALTKITTPGGRITLIGYTRPPAPTPARSTRSRA